MSTEYTKFFLHPECSMFHKGALLSKANITIQSIVRTLSNFHKRQRLCEIINSIKIITVHIVFRLPIRAKQSQKSIR